MRASSVTSSLNCASLTSSPNSSTGRSTIRSTVSPQSLARLGEVFSYAGLESEELLVDGIRVRVATPLMLHRMKKDTVRPRDKMDAAWIRETFALTEE